MSFLRIRGYIETLRAHHKHISTLPETADGSTIEEMLDFLDECEKLHPAAISETIGLPCHLQNRWVSSLDKLNSAHRQLITAVTCPLPEKRLQYDYGLLELLEAAQRELDSLENEPRTGHVAHSTPRDVAEPTAEETS